MVSILGDYNYTFPKPIPLKLKLKDMLEENVDEKYYLSDKMLQGMINTNFESYKLENRLQDKNKVYDTLLTNSGNRCPHLIPIKSAYLRNYGSKGKLQEKDCCDTLTSAMGNGGGNTPIIQIKNATKKGYLEAEDGDGIDISSRMQYHRGTVQKQKAQTISTMGGENVGVIVNENN